MILFIVCCVCYFFFFKQKTAYEMRISDWSSDVCSSDLSKGGNVSLSKESPGLDEIMIGLGWDVRATDGQDFDLDASAFVLKADGKVRGDTDFCFRSEERRVGKECVSTC